MINVISVATAQVGNGHACHAMVLDCVLADIQKDHQGNTVFDSNGDPELENFSFKFKNTYKNNKEIVMEAGKIKSIYKLTSLSIQTTRTLRLYFIILTLTLFLQRSNSDGKIRLIICCASNPSKNKLIQIKK